VIILAIDPGPEESAYAVFDLERLRLVCFSKDKNEDVLKVIDDASYLLFDKLIVEMIASQGMAVGQTTFETCAWVGRFIERWGRDCELIYRHEEKTYICGNSRAKDKNIRQALIDMFGGESVAIGNKKCPSCKGKGYTGRQRMQCEECKGAGWKYPPGPLCGIAGDVWAALAVAVTYGLREKMLRFSGATLAVHDKSSPRSDRDTS
jgi:hypothetical protein